MNKLLIKACSIVLVLLVITSSLNLFMPVARAYSYNNQTVHVGKVSEINSNDTIAPRMALSKNKAALMNLRELALAPDDLIDNGNLEQNGYDAVSLTEVEVPVTVTDVSLNKSSTTLTVGQSEQLTALISPENANNKGVTWSVNSQSVDNVVTVSSIGLVTTLNPGNAVIRATSKTDETKYDECNILVKAAPVATSIEIVGPEKLRISGKGDFSAIIRDQHGEILSEKDVVWSISTKTNTAFIDSDTGLVSVTDDATLGSQIIIKAALRNDNFVQIEKTLPIIEKLDIKQEKYCGQYQNIGFIKNDGSLWQIKNSTSAPEIIKIDSGVWASVCLRNFSGYGVKSDGSLWAWGINSKGFDTSVTDYSKPNQIGNEQDWVSVSASDSYALAIKSDGTLWSWGYNGYGQLGNNSYIDSVTPQKIGDSNNWIYASADGYASFAMQSDGSLWCWGRNFGQLGDGSAIDRPIPTKINSEIGWASISAGYSYSIATKEDGSLWAWGINNNGQLGDGTRTNRLSPVRIGLESDWDSVNCGYLITAVKIDGSLWAWQPEIVSGNQYDGYKYLSFPTKINYSNGWEKSILGNGYMIAKRDDDTYWMWGAFRPGGPDMRIISFINDVPTQLVNDNTIAATETALAAINAGTEVIMDYASAGVTGGIARNLAEYKKAISLAKESKGSNLLLSEVQIVVNNVNIEAEKIAAPQITGFTWEQGSTVGTTKATVVPAGTIKYIVGAAGSQVQPNVGDAATAYTNILTANADISISAGQHIFIIGVGNDGNIASWADLAVSESNINLERIQGDVNNDSVVDALDFALMRLYLLRETANINKINSDMNLDGEIDAIDFELLKMQLLNQC